MEHHAEGTPAFPHRVNLDGDLFVLPSGMPVRAAVLRDHQVAPGCLQREIAAARMIQPRQEGFLEKLVIADCVHHALGVAIPGRDAQREAMAVLPGHATGSRRWMVTTSREISHVPSALV
jgi:hypothetical protein